MLNDVVACNKPWSASARLKHVLHGRATITTAAASSKTKHVATTWVRNTFAIQATLTFTIGLTHVARVLRLRLPGSCPEISKQEETIFLARADLSLPKDKGRVRTKNLFILASKTRHREGRLYFDKFGH